MSYVRGIISTYASGVDAVFEWKIKKFFHLPETDGKYYWSPSFSFGGGRWRLSIHPNVWSVSDSSGHVDLGLFKRASDRSSRQSFSLSLKTGRGDKYNEQHFSKDFNNYNFFYAFNRFIQRSELRSELLPEDVLTVVCTMKNTTSDRSASNSGSAEYCTSDSDSAASFSDSDSAASFSDSDSDECCHKCSDCLDIVKKQKKLLEELQCQKKRSEEEEASNAEVNKSDVPEASGSNQAGTTTTKESVLMCIKEICKEASKGKKRKLKEENALKWIEENCKEASKEKKWKMEEENNDGSLCQDFKKLLLEGLNHDLILKVGDKELRAHRDVLRARSQVFKAMLDHDMKEKKSGIIDIPDCDPLAMEQFLFYIYSGNIEVLDQSNMLNLYYIADKYEMKGLKKECSDFIKKSLSQANICGVIQLALNHSDSSLLESTTVYFRNNMLGIMRTVQWQIFMKENSTVANELLIKAVENLSSVKS